MLDHLGIQCEDMNAASAFYDQVLAPIGGARIIDFEIAIGYGGADGKPDFWISALAEGTTNRPTHHCFTASSRADVDAFFAAAVAARRRGAARAARLARVPPQLLRRVRARPRRQQRRGRLPPPRMS